MVDTPPIDAEPRGRVHVVLVPGFAGFDALGQLEYFAGTTQAFREWRSGRDLGGRGAALHYFDTLPTAGVETRAERLRSFLAKRIARGEIQGHDTIALVGHSTGGLDIRRLLFTGDPVEPMHLDGGAAHLGGVAASQAKRMGQTAVDIGQDEILDRVNRAVFVSVPQYGTNIADWVRAHGALRRLALQDLRGAVEGARVRQVQAASSEVLEALTAPTRGSDVLLAASDALDETQVSAGDPQVRSLAREAGSALRLWLSHAADDFGAIDDLSSFKNPPPDSRSPAHYDGGAREAEEELWRSKHIATMSIATISRRAFRFPVGREAPRLRFADPRTWPHRELVDGSDQMDLTYLLAYRACAGGGFELPPPVAECGAEIGGFDTRLFIAARLGPDGPDAGAEVQVWDNDGIVNTSSMLWPDRGRTLLVAADHGDIIGHFDLRPTIPSPDATGRRFASYDLLGSGTQFTAEDFRKVWETIFDFCAS